MKDSELTVGDKMRKLSGYSFDGVIVADFTNTRGDRRFVCELEGSNGGGMLHIFSPAQIEARP